MIGPVVAVILYALGGICLWAACGWLICRVGGKPHPEADEDPGVLVDEYTAMLMDDPDRMDPSADVETTEGGGHKARPNDNSPNDEENK